VPTISENTIKVLLGAIAAVCSFLLVQPDLILEPGIKVLLGAVIVALAVINPATVSARTIPK
jgi:hypothetical protein